MKSLRRRITGLPEHALLQKNGNKIYVFFSYDWRTQGSKFQEKDYIGQVIDNRFVPNDDYLLNRYEKKDRPLHKWKDPEKRKKMEILARLRNGLSEDA